MRTPTAPFFLLAAGMLLPACASPRVTRQNIAGTTTHLQVTELPGCRVHASNPADAVARRNDQGFLELQVVLRNPSSSARNFSYSWEWFGPDGRASTTPATRVPRTGRIEGHDQTIVTTVSTVSQPSGVVLRIGPQS